jgi:MYXO-CTERM domain-containing protein
MGSLQSPPMEPPSPARLYATAIGAFLLVLGIVGFFSSASFGGPGSVEASLGALRVNGWLNVLHIATGALGLLVAGYASRAYALALGALYTALAIWGFAIGSGEAILGFLPASGGDDALHLVLGLLGLAAVAGTRKRQPAKRRGALKPRAQAAGEGP